MAEQNYLGWLSGKTATSWWHDSGDPGELREALTNGATGVTTNPILCAQALQNNRALWVEEIGRAIAAEKTPSARAESLMRIVVAHAAGQLEPIHRASGGRQGYVCAQVNPALAGDRDAMYAMGRRFRAWAPNIAVKLPATSAGLDVMERLCSEGTAVTITVSFTVSQALEAGRRYQQVVRGGKGGGGVGRCFAVIMIGRLDDYLREVAADNREPVTEQELQMAGLSVTRKAYRLFREHGFAATLMVAALRGNYHVTGLAGGELVLSIHPTWQRSLLAGHVADGKGIDEPINPAIPEKLGRLPEFTKAYEVEALPAKEMISFGLTQRTLASFSESGWKVLEHFRS